MQKVREKSSSSEDDRREVLRVRYIIREICARQTLNGALRDLWKAAPPDKRPKGGDSFLAALKYLQQEKSNAIALSAKCLVAEPFRQALLQAKESKNPNQRIFTYQEVLPSPFC
jgi:hypothetical protein